MKKMAGEVETGRVKSPFKSPRKQWNPSSVESDDYLVSLTRRLDVLEQKLVGKRSLKADQPPLAPTVKTLQQKLTDGLGGGNQAHIHTLWNKIESLERILNPNYTTTLSVSQSVKEDLLLGYVSQVKSVKEQVEELQQLKDYINTTEFQGLDSHEKKLAAIANVHCHHEQKIEEISHQARELLKVYNQIILQLSAQCVEWEEKLTQAESKQ